MTDEQKLTDQLLVNNSNSCAAETADQKKLLKQYLVGRAKRVLSFRSTARICVCPFRRRIGLRPNALCQPIVIIFA